MAIAAMTLILFKFVELYNVFYVFGSVINEYTANCSLKLEIIIST